MMSSIATSSSASTATAASTVTSPKAQQLQITHNVQPNDNLAFLAARIRGYRSAYDSGEKKKRWAPGLFREVSDLLVCANALDKERISKVLLIKDFNDLQAQLESFQHERCTLQDTIRQREREAGEATKEWLDLNKQFTELRNSNSNLQFMSAGALQDKKGLAAENAKLQATVNKLEQRLRVKDAEENAIARSKGELQQENAELKAQLEELQRRETGLRSDAVGLREQYLDLKAKLDRILSMLHKKQIRSVQGAIQSSLEQMIDRLGGGEDSPRRPSSSSNAGVEKCQPHTPSKIRPSPSGVFVRGGTPSSGRHARTAAVADDKEKEGQQESGSARKRRRAGT